MTENLQITMAAINKWVFFSLNYNVVPYTNKNNNNEIVHVPEFIPAIKWTCPINHMIAKWELVTQSENPYTYLIKFYIELDTRNRMLLLEWILGHYNDEIKLWN